MFGKALNKINYKHIWLQYWQYDEDIVLDEQENKTYFYFDINTVLQKI